ncbi:LysR substrate-binding domain-containing protein [Franconibacter pulveris 1160]|uniref:LysR substrate-binding domain-containing protein n=1 Tax=Franconibacter pulveris TaxID=435910 RepID=UPI000466FBEF|nr:LysR substrate-binding domain-containing protein [Franconibacter pulveris]
MRALLDVLIILDALDKEGSFAAAASRLYKTPSALSYTVHKLESDLNIQVLDRSGHRARFTPTGAMLLDKGREVLQTVRDLEKQAVKLHLGWENELVIGIDDTFPFTLLFPHIEAFLQLHEMTRLKFINGVLGGSWESLTQGRVDLVIGAMRAPPPLSGFSFTLLGHLASVFAVAPHHPLAQASEPLSRRLIKRYRAVAVADPASTHLSFASGVLDDQDAVTVFDFKAKLELQLRGIGCGWLPRYLAQQYLDSGALVEKEVASHVPYEPVWIGWNEQTAGLACAWWREQILSNSEITALYSAPAPHDGG